MQKRKSFTVLAAAFGALAGTLVLAAGAAATAPIMEPIDFSYSADYAAGTVCDFNLHEEVTVTGWDEIFFDQAGNYVRDTAHITVAVTHLNSDTGYMLTEAGDHQIQTFVEATQQVKVVGLQGLLKDSTGRSVLAAAAGQLIFDVSIGEVTKVTPNFGPDFAEVICPALGGNPA
jgi:hypothetical protein